MTEYYNETPRLGIKKVRQGIVKEEKHLIFYNSWKTLFPSVIRYHILPFINCLIIYMVLKSFLGVFNFNDYAFYSRINNEFTFKLSAPPPAKNIS